MTGTMQPAPVLPRIGGHVLYPNLYTWFVLAGFLDVIVTVFVLTHLGAREVNMLAVEYIDLFGTWGLIALKAGTILVVVLVCELIGRYRRRLGRTIAVGAIIVSMLPVAAALAQTGWLLARGDLVVVPEAEDGG